MRRDEAAEVAIVGAGIAGTFLAALLGDPSVLLLERLRTGSASPAIATLWPDALFLLDAIGVGPDLEARQLPRVTRVSIARPDGSRAEGPVPYYLGRDYAIGPRRETLLSILHERVARSAVQFRRSTRVLSAEWNPRTKQWSVHTQDRAGSRTVTADVLVAADGRFSSVAPFMHAHRYDVRTMHNRLRFQYARVPIDWPFASEFRTYHGNSGAAHGFIQPADLGEVGVGLEGTRLTGRRPSFLAELDDVERLQEDCGRLQWLGRPVEVPLGSMWKQRPRTDNSLLIGDAGLYMDPVTGQGVGNALLSAALAFRAIKRFRRRQGQWHQVQCEFVRDRDRYTAADYERAASAGRFEEPTGVPTPVPLSSELAKYTNRTLPDGTPRELNIWLRDLFSSEPGSDHEIGGRQ